MTTSKQVYDIAKSHLGHRGSHARAFCGMSGGPYCCAFVTMCMHKSGGAKLFYGGKKCTYCPNAIRWCQANLAMVPPYLAMRMDFIFFDWQPNGTPDHIGFVLEKISTDKIKTLEGNTSGGIVAVKTRGGYIQGIFRPHYTPDRKLEKSKLKLDCDFGYMSIFMFQTALKQKADGILKKSDVKAWQKKVGAGEDGAWGPKTSRKAQTFLKKAGCYTGAIDGEWGPASTKGLQTWCNRVCFPEEKPATKKTETKKPEVKKETVTKKPETKPKEKTTAKTSKTTTKTPAKKATLKGYKIEVDLTNQIATVYGVYSDGSKKPIMSEFVSTARKGKTTPVGDFKIQGASGGRRAKLRTALMSSKKTYAEYLCRFHGAKCMHCVPYKKRNTVGLVYKSEFNKLGTPASAGCVRMPNKMAKFIYENCPLGTPVKVFKGEKGKFPMGKPKKYKATSNVDPTYKK